MWQQRIRVLALRVSAVKCRHGHAVPQVMDMRRPSVTIEDAGAAAQSQPVLPQGGAGHAIAGARCATAPDQGAVWIKALPVLWPTGEKSLQCAGDRGVERNQSGFMKLGRFNAQNFSPAVVMTQP